MLQIIKNGLTVIDWASPIYCSRIPPKGTSDGRTREQREKTTSFGAVPVRWSDIFRWIPTILSGTTVVLVNDVTDILPSHCTSKLFADDLKLYSVAHTCEDNALIIRKSLEKHFHWSNEWQLTISYQKCSMMSVGHSNSTDCFNMGSNSVQPVCVTKDLGVHVCSDLSFATHVNNIAYSQGACPSVLNTQVFYIKRRSHTY